MNTSPEDAVSADGRHLRRERNRTAIIEALVAFYAEGNADPSTTEVAERAGLSERSLFRYFDDLDDLCRSAFTALFAGTEALTRIKDFGTGTTADKIAAVVTQRMRIHGEMGPTMAIARAKAASLPVVAELIAASRAAARNQIALHFDEELARLDTWERREVLTLIDALLSFETWQSMAHHQRLGAATIRSALTRGLATILPDGSGR